MNAKQYNKIHGTPPPPQNLNGRLKYFLEHPDHPKARWEVFHLTNEKINRKYKGKLITPELKKAYLDEMDELDRTQGWPDNTPKKSELQKLGEKMGLNV